MKLLALVILSCLTVSLYAQNHIKFVVFADLHYDMMPDGDVRLQTILNAAKKSKSGFIVNLGDLSAPVPAYQVIKDRFDNCPLPVYHVIGNHDTDKAGKQAFMDFYGMKAPYYYIDKGKFRLIFLDSNFFIDKDGQEKSFHKVNYAGSQRINLFSSEELGWLKEALNTEQVCLIFSHAPVNDGHDKIIDNREIHQLLTDARESGTQIAAVFGGHIHSDNYHVIDGINYMQVNGASNIWGGANFINTERYPAEVYKKYSSLKYIIPYKDALYAIVNVNTKGKVRIEGVKSGYVEPAPDPEKLKTKPYPCSAEIPDRKFTYK